MNATAILDIVPEAFSCVSQSLTETPLPVGKSLPADCVNLKSALPKVGDEFYGYELVELLGEGAFAKVFLARERQLADRLVVLKIAVKPSYEPLRLAKLQHTNIVQIQTAFRVGPFHVVQMPFLGRQTLAHVIEHVRATTGFPIVGGEVFTTMARMSTHQDTKIDLAPSKNPTEVTIAAKHESQSLSLEVLESHPLRDMLTEMSYPRAVLTIMRRLADGLAHAHARGILHLDLKPHNVLFDEDGQPLLLDFNLSRDRSNLDHNRVGGTWPYMAPEAFREYVGDPEAKSDERTDLYSLGVMFYQLLTCRLPFPTTHFRADMVAEAVKVREEFVSDLRIHNPEVSQSLEAIIIKLLAANPDDRYQTVDELREDLRCEAEYRPLIHVTEPSLSERFHKWQKRNPGLLARIAASAVAISLVAGLIAFTNVQSQKNQHVAANAAREFHTSLESARLDASFVTDRRTRQEGKATLVKLLQGYGVGTSATWQQEGQIQNLEESRKLEVLQNLREAALLVAHAEMLDARLKTGDERTLFLEQARQWNTTAEQITSGTIPGSLWQQRKELAELLGDDALAATVPATITFADTTEDLYLRAVTMVANKDLPAAIRLGQQLTLKAPSHYAGHSLLGICYYFTGQPQLAADRFLVARPLARCSQTALHNRAVTLTSVGKYDFAEADLTTLLAMAPENYEALILRGHIRECQGKLRDAVADYTAAMEARGPQMLLRDVRARCYDKLKDEKAAREDREKIAALKPTTKEDHLFVAKHLAKTKPTEALAHYNEALRLDPEYIGAYQAKTHLLADVLHEWELAIQVQDQLEKLALDSAYGLASRAVLYARMGKTDECLKVLERVSSRTLDSVAVYTIASAYAVLGRTNKAHRETALRYLRRAVRDGFRDVQHIEGDADMSAIRETPEYKTILQLAREIVK